MRAGNMNTEQKLKAAREHVVGRITDIIVKNFDEGGSALETAGTFTTLLEAFNAIEIAIANKPNAPLDLEKLL